MTDKAVIFDIDGTLLDTSIPILASVNDALSKLNLPTKTWDSCVHFVGHGLEYLARGVAPPYIDQKTSDQLVELYREHHAAHFGNGAAPYPGIKTLLGHLKKDGWCLGILSNKPMAFAEDIIKQHFAGMFDVVLGKQDGLPFKPQPQALFWVCEKLNVAVTNTIFVGDSQVDLTTALEAQMKCVIVSWGFDRFSSEVPLVKTTDELYEKISAL